MADERQGASRQQLENSLLILGDLNQMLDTLGRYAVMNQQVDVTGNIQTILGGLYQSVRQSIQSINQQIIAHNEALDDLDEIEELDRMFGE